MSAQKGVGSVPGAVIGAFVVASLSPVTGINATESPFHSNQLPGGYMLAADEAAKGREGKCGEGKCGSKAETEAVCGIYTVGSSHKDDSRVKDGKCGGHRVVEALCGSDR